MILIAIPAAIVAAVSIGAFFGRWVWWLDVAANFRAQYLVVLTVFGVLLMVAKWRRTGSGVLLVAAVNLVVVLPLYAGNPGESDPFRPSVTVMTFNIFSPNQEYGEVLDYIGRLRPDLVLIHEASRPWEVAVEALGGDYRIIRPRSDDLIFGTLVLSRAAVVEWTSYGFGTTEPRAVALNVRPDGWDQPLHVYSVHPLAPTDRERARIRDGQLRFATEWAMEQDGAFVVVGDLNATPWSWAFRRLEGSTDLRNSQIGFGLQASFPADGNPVTRVPIDHVLHSAALGVRDRYLGPTMGSDHFPVIAVLELR